MSRSRLLGLVVLAAVALGGVQVGRLALTRPAGAPSALVARSSTPLPRASAEAPRASASPPRSAAMAVLPTSDRRAAGRPGQPRPAAHPVELRQALAQAAALAAEHGVRAGIAVLDLRSGRLLGAGQATAEFGTASVVKVLIAAYLLANHRLSGATADLAYSMITRSDDDAANLLWEQAGGPLVEPWIEQHYGLPGLGSPNAIPGRWGNTHVTPTGLVRLYAKLRLDPDVWPWLSRAMHHATRIAKDGTDQFFGLPAIAPGAAVKQGWGSGSADADGAATVNSTGYLDHDRYAVAILTEGAHNDDTTDARGYNAAQASLVTSMARMLAPIAG
jgi:hypothetical protein